MSNLIEEILISRSSMNDATKILIIYFFDNDHVLHRKDAVRFPLSFVNEDEIVATLLDNFLRTYYSDYLSVISEEQLRLKIIEGFRQLRRNDLNGNNRETMAISLVPQGQLEPHFSCKMNKNGDDTTQSSGENDISQSKLQQKLSIVDKDSEIMKFFEDNKCSVCLSSYKEALDENLHIIVPSCGHPLCCECADNILRSEKKECPRCRGNITGDSFNLMKFNADLQMVTQDQRVFL